MEVFPLYQYFFVHKFAYNNFKTNFIFHDQVAEFLPKLFKYKGVINVGGKSRTVYNFSKKYNPKIKGKKLTKKSGLLKINTSMNIDKLKKIINDKILVL